MSKETLPTRVLVVHHDRDMGDQEADFLRLKGYSVEQCSGPASYSCPVMRGERCEAVERADVLVYDVWSTTESDGSRRLVENLRELHPNIPLILTAPGIELNWVETQGVHSVTPLVGTPTAQRLHGAITEALRSDVLPAAAG